MLVIEHGIQPHLKEESQFTWSSYDPSDEKPEYDPVDVLRVHPWHRDVGTGYESSRVFLSIQCGAEETDTNLQNIIVERDEFVAGILAVFPELQRRVDDE